MCDGDPRAVAQLALIAINNRQIGYAKTKHLVMDRFQRDVLSDLEQRLSWVNTVIKSAPMVGLFGTVMGMMGAFGKLANQANVSPDVLANDIYVDPVVVSVQVFPQYGILGIVSGGIFEYTPNAGFVGTDSFTYQLCDTGGQCDTANVTITVGP